MDPVALLLTSPALRAREAIGGTFERRPMARAFLFAFFGLLPGAAVLAQSPAAAPSGGTPPAAAGIAAAKGPDAARAETEAVLVTLATKANGGDGEAARKLVAQVVSGAAVTMDASFRREVEAASETEANRILAVTLLRTADETLHSLGIACVDKAIQGRSPLAMELKARILLEGRFGVGKSVEKAVELLRQARQLPGSVEADRLLGDLALTGTGMPKDAAIALEYYRRGAEAGSNPCKLALHRLYREGVELPRDPVEAERHGRAAAESGDAEAAFELGLFYERFSGDTPEWLRASEWMRTAAERGHAAAALRLAEYHLEGRLGPVNSAEGVRLLRVAAGLGSGEAAFRIGEAYKEGTHLPLDAVASTAWFARAAEAGNAPAENAYGLALATGAGIKADPAAAAEWFRKAAEQGSLDAKVNLGELHQHGVGVERDAALASGFFEEAARAGSGIGAHKLAEFLAASGGAAGSDPVAPAFWADRAVSLGRNEAADLAGRLRAGLTPERRAELDRRLAAEKAKGGTAKSVAN